MFFNAYFQSTAGPFEILNHLKLLSIDTCIDIYNYCFLSTKSDDATVRTFLWTNFKLLLVRICQITNELVYNISYKLEVDFIILIFIYSVIIFLKKKHSNFILKFVRSRIIAGLFARRRFFEYCCILQLYNCIASLFVLSHSF